MSLIDDAILLKMAEAELLEEAKKAAVRHSTAGVSGWQPCPKPNKMFLTNTLLQTMASNRLVTRKSVGKKDRISKPERKLLQQKHRTDMETNFIYQKPKKNKDKPTFSSESSKLRQKERKSESRHSKSVKETNKKCNFIKVKLKKTEFF